MRIFSAFHDYYDIGLSYGVDPDIHYKRNTLSFRHTDDISDPDLKRLRSWKPSPSVTVIGSCEELVTVVFCGKVYHGVVFWGRPGYNYVWSFEQFTKSYGDRGVLSNEKKRRKVMRNAEAYFSEQGRSVSDEMLDLLLNRRLPIVLWGYDLGWRSFVVDPVLSEWRFFTVFPPVEAFQEISRFLGMTGSPEPKVLKVDEKIRLIERGFDPVTSFRKM